MSGLLVAARGNSGTNPTPVPAKIEAIELAAAYAASQPFTPPRPDQWIYLELEARPARPGRASKGQKTDEVSQQWSRADGRQNAGWDNGQLVVTADDPTASFPPRTTRLWPRCRPTRRNCSPG